MKNNFEKVQIDFNILSFYIHAFSLFDFSLQGLQHFLLTLFDFF